MEQHVILPQVFSSYSYKAVENAYRKTLIKEKKIYERKLNGRSEAGVEQILV